METPNNNVLASRRLTEEEKGWFFPKGDPLAQEDRTYNFTDLGEPPVDGKTHVSIQMEDGTEIAKTWL